MVNDAERGEAQKLAAEIMVAMRQARFPKEYADEAHDEFESLTLVPMLSGAIAAIAAMPASEVVEAGSDLLALIRSLSEGRTGPFAILNCIHNSAQFEALDAALAKHDDRGGQ